MAGFLIIIYLLLSFRLEVLYGNGNYPLILYFATWTNWCSEREWCSKTALSLIREQTIQYLIVMEKYGAKWFTFDNNT